MRAADRIAELGSQGMYCSQILLTLGLDLRGEDNPELVKSMAGLAGGLGFTGGTCGSSVSTPGGDRPRRKRTTGSS